MKKIYYLLILLLFSFPALAQLKLVASYPPIQSLVWSVSQGVSPVSVLISTPGDGNRFKLSSSKKKILVKADIVFWVDPTFETFLPDLIVSRSTYSVPLLKSVPELKVKYLSDKKIPDPYFWMNIDNAILTVNKIAEILIEHDPKNEQTYLKNKETSISYLRKLKETKLNKEPASIISLEDSFSYFNESFPLNIKKAPVELSKLDHKNRTLLLNFIKKENPACILVPPTTKKRMIQNLGLKKYPVQKIDAFGWNINFGPAQYYHMIQWDLDYIQKCILSK